MTVGIQSNARSGRKVERRRRALPGRASVRRPLTVRVRAGWTALLLAVTLSLSWQSLLTQTHQHPASTFAPIAAKLLGTNASADLPDRKSSDQPADCPICRVIAHAGHYLSPALGSFDTPIATAFSFAAPAALHTAIVQRSHAWQSRAPPTLLQA